MNQESVKHQESVVPQVFDFRDMDDGDIYDETQCNDDIRTGDVMLTGSGVAIMYSAWPVMVVGTSRVLHTVSTTWDHIFADYILVNHPEKLARLKEGLLVAWALSCG